MRIEETAVNETYFCDIYQIICIEILSQLSPSLALSSTVVFGALISNIFEKKPLARTVCVKGTCFVNESGRTFRVLLRVFFFSFI